ncbi:MAG: hypothetical protein PHY92_02685 [Alphaproteobacteria bacterium]|nr:hypothetical protein [Alphaproteobacteria bacterium]
MERIALITDVDQDKIRKRIQPLKECGYKVDHYRTPDHFIENHQKNPAPDLIVSAVNFPSSGLKEWQNINRLLEIRVTSAALENARILTYSVFTYHQGEIPALCHAAMEYKLLGHVYMDQWIGSERNPDCFRDTVVPHIKEYFTHRRGEPVRLHRDFLTLHNLNTRGNTGQLAL